MLICVKEMRAAREQPTLWRLWLGAMHVSESALTANKSPQVNVYNQSTGQCVEDWPWKHSQKVTHCVLVFCNNFVLHNHDCEKHWPYILCWLYLTHTPSPYTGNTIIFVGVCVYVGHKKCPHKFINLRSSYPPILSMYHKVGSKDSWGCVIHRQQPKLGIETCILEMWGSNCTCITRKPLPIEKSFVKKTNND